MIESMPRLDPQQVHLLHEAAEWRLLSLLFEHPHDGWREGVAALGADVGDPRLRAAAEAAQDEASPGLHHSLFGPGGPVSLREVTYVGGIQLGYLLSELEAYYRAFAYTPAAKEPSDDLSVELGFVSYLTLKQAYALASSDPEHAAVTAEAAARFRAEHLSLMAERIAGALEAGGPPYLALASAVMRERVGPAPSGRPEAGGPMAGDDLSAEMSCGMSADAAACAGSCDLPPDVDE